MFASGLLIRKEMSQTGEDSIFVVGRPVAPGRPTRPPDRQPLRARYAATTTTDTVASSSNPSHRTPEYQLYLHTNQESDQIELSLCVLQI